MERGLLIERSSFYPNLFAALYEGLKGCLPLFLMLGFRNQFLISITKFLRPRVEDLESSMYAAFVLDKTLDASPKLFPWVFNVVT